jgi:hypothetical protein
MKLKQYYLGQAWAILGKLGLSWASLGALAWATLAYLGLPWTTLGYLGLKFKKKNWDFFWNFFFREIFYRIEEICEVDPRVFLKLSYFLFLVKSGRPMLHD